MANAADVKTVAIGLQGGGSHSAFAWGVLDELLEKVGQGKLRITAISGASGGALNGAVCAYGLRQKAKAAQDLLRKFWISVSEKSLWPENPFRSMFPDNSPKRWNVDLNPLAIGFGMAQQITSPYVNPLGAHNILRPLLAEVIPDFSAFADSSAPRLYVSATAVDRTALRIFRPEEITIDALLASACLPTFFEAVTIDGTPYWDGGYLANPALNPLLDHADDLLTILIDPLVVTGGPPVTPRQIVNRINEVSFNASWVLEMRQIHLINKFCEDGLLEGSKKKYTFKRLHLIRNDAYMEAIGAASKIVPSRDFLLALHEEGRRTARDWLALNFDKIGESSSLDADAKVALRLKGSHSAVANLRLQ